LGHGVVNVGREVGVERGQPDQPGVVVSQHKTAVVKADVLEPFEGRRLQEVGEALACGAELVGVAGLHPEQRCRFGLDAVAGAETGLLVGDTGFLRRRAHRSLSCWLVVVVVYESSSDNQRSALIEGAKQYSPPRVVTKRGNPCSRRRI